MSNTIKQALTSLHRNQSVQCSTYIEKYLRGKISWCMNTHFWVNVHTLVYRSFDLRVWHKIATHFPNCGANWSKLSSGFILNTESTLYWMELKPRLTFKIGNTVGLLNHYQDSRTIAVYDPTEIVQLLFLTQHLYKNVGSFLVKNIMGCWLYLILYYIKVLIC